MTSPPAREAGGLGTPALLVVHSSFVLTGMVTTLLGPILPLLAAKWSLSDSQAGAFFTAQFAGSISGVMLHTTLARRSSRFLLMVGMATMSAGVGTLAMGSATLGVAATFVYGIGLGLTIPTSNLLVAEANPTRRAAALNILNLAWGLGALLWPVVTLAAESISRGFVLLEVLAGLLVLAAVAVAMVFPIAAAGREESQQAAAGQSPWRNGTVPLLGLLFFVYVGTETGVAGWAATYAQRSVSGADNMWPMMPAFFWAALLLGRGLAPFILRYQEERTLVLGSLALSTCGVAAMLTASTALGLAASVALAGLGLAPVFPGAVAMLSEHFGASAARVAGTMFALAGLGGATLPWAVGYCSSYFGSLKVGLVVPLAGAALMMGLVMGPLPTGKRSQVAIGP